MLLKNSITIGGLVVGATLLASLAGCTSHKNPLKAAPPVIGGKFVYSASKVAEKKLHVFQQSGGDAYNQCMTGKAKKAFCSKLYQAMVDYAKTREDFKSLTVSDLKDATVFNNLKEYYARERFIAA